VPTSEALENTIKQLMPYVTTTTMLVLSSPITRRTIEPLE
jgi:hypothetical protein